jgi:hypothetical protein
MTPSDFMGGVWFSASAGQNRTLDLEGDHVLSNHLHFDINICYTISNRMLTEEK